jgi:hypothetical protein
MSLSQSSLSKPNVASAMPHIQVAGEACPLCDQPIPRDRFEEVKARIETRQAANDSALAKRLNDQFAQQMADAREQERNLASERLESSVTQARREERALAETATNQRLADATRASKEAEAAMQLRIEEVERANTAAEQLHNALKAQLEQVRLDNETAIQRVREEADANAVLIRAESQSQAKIDAQERVAELERQHVESTGALRTRVDAAEAAKADAQSSLAALQARLEQTRDDHDAELEKIRRQSEANATVIREEANRNARAEVAKELAALESARQESVTAYEGRIQEAENAKAVAEAANGQLKADLEQARADTDTQVANAQREATMVVEAAARAKIDDAEAKARAAEEQNRLLREAHGAELEQRVREVRESMERAQTDAVNAEKSAAFEKERKLSDKVEGLQRALDNKTAEDLGEGAEIDLFEVLKHQFEGDRIERINKGQPGADIRHVVIHNGKECGRLIYDSKNHNAWRNEFVTKLSADQMADKADHAILATRKFPKGARHLHVQDGVILASPPRIAALTVIIREHVIATHTLRLSAEARTQKTAELYALITSGRFRDTLKRIDTNADKLFDLQEKEKRAHETMWENQGKLIRAMQKVHAEVTTEIELIVGTADVLETGSE